MQIEPGTSPKHRYELIKSTLLVIIGALITITVVYGIDYFSPKAEPTPVAVEPVAKTETVVEEKSTPTPAPTPEATKEKVYSQEELNKIFEMDKKSKDTKLFYSEKLGVGFTYAPLKEDPKSRILSIKEIDSKIVIIDQDSGQLGDKVFEYPNIEVFSKDSNDNLEKAITKELLQGVDSKKCFAKKYTDGDSSGKQLEGYTYAEISYAPTPGSDAVINNGIENCPKKVQNYATTNAVQFFLEDPKTPYKYVFLRLAQESIASSGLGNEGWERSIRILK
jgi:hypothetical protein